MKSYFNTPENIFFDMRIKIDSEEKLLEVCRKFIHISVNMRYWQSQWKEHYGCVNRKHKEEWEEKMDKFLKELEVNYSKESIDKISIEIEK